jgi:signal transduction histidine kinase
MLTVALSLEALAQKEAIVPPPVRRVLAARVRDIQKITESTRNFLARMHPAVLEKVGLVAALRDECATFARQHGIYCQFEERHTPRTLPKDVALCLYRISQESLQNVRKHSRASRVQVQLGATRSKITLRIQDNGRGFDPAEHTKRKEAGHLGLVSMAERAMMVGGELHIVSSPGNGTIVEIKIPLRGKPK